MGIKLTISVLAYKCHDRNLFSYLLGKMAIERKQQKRQEKLEKMRSCCITELWHRNEWLQRNKQPHTSFPQSTCTLVSLGDLFCFKYGVAFPRVTEKNTKSNYFHLLWIVTGSEYTDSKLLVGSWQMLACVSNPLDQKPSWVLLLFKSTELLWDLSLRPN